MELVISMAAGFLLCFLSYRQGLKDGLSSRGGQMVAPVIKMPQRATEEPVDPLRDAINNIMAYDGSPQGVDDE